MTPKSARKNLLQLVPNTSFSVRNFNKLSFENLKNPFIIKSNKHSKDSLDYFEESQEENLGSEKIEILGKLNKKSRTESHIKKKDKNKEKDLKGKIEKKKRNNSQIRDSKNLENYYNLPIKYLKIKEEYEEIAHHLNLVSYMKEISFVIQEIFFNKKITDVHLLDLKSKIKLKITKFS